MAATTANTRQAQPTNDNMSEKKRKRNGESDSRPTKKAAIAPQGTVKVELLENKDALGPLLGMRSFVCTLCGGVADG